MLNLDLIAGVLSFLFTLMVFSYLIGDNPAFRVAVYLFVGVTAGYVTFTAVDQVLWPSLIKPLIDDTAGNVLLFVPLFFCVLVLMKMSGNLEWLGSPAMGFMVGVGAAVAVGGAVLGTILPQVQATSSLPGLGQLANDPTGMMAQNLFQGVVILIGTLSTLIYFHFGAKAKPGEAPQRAKVIDIMAWVGRIFVSITFGVLFAGLYAAALTALIERFVSLSSLFSLF